MSARKIPPLRLALILVQLLWCFDEVLAAQQPDTAALFKRARRAEAEYRSAIRRYAPRVPGVPSGLPCDEIVGRFCVYYDTGREDLPAEPKQIKAARDSAIAAIERSLNAAPDRTDLVFELTRMMAAAGRANEAVRYARRDSSATGREILAFALQLAGRTEESLASRTTFPNPELLLNHAERKRYRKLATSSQRNGYDSLLWRYADPLYITPGNEVLAEHYSRELLSRRIRDDDPELVVRFGAPVMVTKSWGHSSINAEDQFSEHWDPAERTYVPPSLTDALALEARVDTIWPVDSLTRRSGHAPSTIRIMRPLQHQAFVRLNPRRLVVTGSAPIDTLVSAKGVVAAIVLLDSALHVLRREAADAVVDVDSVAFRAEVELPAAARYYSAEVYDSVSRFAVRARYRLVFPDSVDDVVLATAAIENPRPVIVAGSSFRLSGELFRIREGGPVRIQISSRGYTRKTRRPKLMGWTIDTQAGLTPIDLTLNLGETPPGKYLITVTASDSDNRWHLTTNRQILVISGSKASSSTRP